VLTVCVTRNVISHVKYILCLCICTFRTICAVPNMAGFCNSPISCPPGMLLRYYVSDFETVQVCPVIIGFTFHMRSIFILRSLYFKYFSSFVLITFLFAEIAACINTHVPCLLTRIVLSSLLLETILSVRTFGSTIRQPCVHEFLY